MALHKHSSGKTPPYEVGAYDAALKSALARLNLKSDHPTPMPADDIETLRTHIRILSRLAIQTLRVVDDLGEQLERTLAENEQLRTVLDEAAAELDIAERDPKAAVRASWCLRTSYPTDHPNYLSREDVLHLLERFDQQDGT